jgi:hypothetical protein
MDGARERIMSGLEDLRGERPIVLPELPTLRDHFAGLAMSAAFDPGHQFSEASPGARQARREYLAAECYRMADAMLRARGDLATDMADPAMMRPKSS